MDWTIRSSDKIQETIFHKWATSVAQAITNFYITDFPLDEPNILFLSNHLKEFGETFNSEKISPLAILKTANVYFEVNKEFMSAQELYLYVEQRKLSNTLPALNLNKTVKPKL